MSDTRPKALVTAAVSGPGLDLLHQLADLVLDSWLDQPSLRIYNAAQLAARVAEDGANIVVVDSNGANVKAATAIGCVGVLGDARREEVLRQAEVPSALRVIRTGMPATSSLR